MPKRYDAGEYRKPEITEAGFLKADAILTRTGVFAYTLGDGTVRRELRLPEEVFKADALKSFEMLPVTNLHPPVPVDAKNVKLFQAGQVGDTVRRDGDFVVAPILVTDAALVRDMQLKNKAQVSCGYDCDLEVAAGEYQGERYDAIQRNIRGNHVAIVPRGRAGPEVRVRLDAADGAAVGIPDRQVQPVSESPNQREGTDMRKITIDGVEYEVTEQVFQAMTKAGAKHADALEAATKAASAAQAELDKTKARADALQADLDKATKARTDAESPARIQQLVAARVAVVTQAQRVLGADVKLDAMDEKAIRAEMLKKLEPELKLDGKSEDYIQGRLDHALERLDRENPAMDRLRADATLVPALDRGGQRKDSEELRREWIRNSEKAYRQPLRHTRETTKQ